MKLDFDKKKNAEEISGFIQGAVNLGKKAVSDTKASVSAMVEKNKADEQVRKLKRYNPLFPEKYQSEGFNIPNIIVIVDDAVRRDVDVCEGAIGWLDKDGGDEVLYLYDEAVEFSKIKFIPAPVCNTVYYVDNFDRSRFIQADTIIDRTRKEKMDELTHIAECIGAKRCLVYISDSSATSEAKQMSADMAGTLYEQTVTGKQKKVANANAAIDYGKTKKSVWEQYANNVIEFRGLRIPKRPKLKWFASDDGINNLVESCCTGKRRVKKMSLEISGSSSSAMTQSVAGTIDGVYRKSLKGSIGVSMKKQVTDESKNKLFFHIEF